MANHDVEREREINEIGKPKVMENNKKWGEKVKKRKEELAKSIKEPKALEKDKGGKKFSHEKDHADAVRRMKKGIIGPII